jgi:hypothetical protein
MINQILILILTAAAAIAGDLPNAKLTPGAFRDVTGAQLCDKSFRTGTVRNVPESERQQAFKLYGVPWTDRQYYECDHLCSLEIGGSNDIKNLWPEPWHWNVSGSDRGAKVKDVLENKMHALVCAGTITLKQAQMMISTNWEAAYLKYIGPFPKYKGTKQIADIHWKEKP